jgi:hypothetical protein
MDKDLNNFFNGFFALINRRKIVSKLCNSGSLTHIKCFKCKEKLRYINIFDYSLTYDESLEKYKINCCAVFRFTYNRLTKSFKYISHFDINS